MKQASFLDEEVPGIRRAPPEPRPRKPPPSAPLAKDGKALVLGSLTTGGRYEPRCLVCGCWLVADELHYGVPMCAGCVRARGGQV